MNEHFFNMNLDENFFFGKLDVFNRRQIDPFVVKLKGKDEFKLKFLEVIFSQSNIFKGKTFKFKKIHINDLYNFLGKYVNFPEVFVVKKIVCENISIEKINMVKNILGSKIKKFLFPILTIANTSQFKKLKNEKKKIQLDFKNYFLENNLLFSNLEEFKIGKKTGITIKELQILLLNSKNLKTLNIENVEFDLFEKKEFFTFILSMKNLKKIILTSRFLLSNKNFAIGKINSLTNITLKITNNLNEQEIKFLEKQMENSKIKVLKLKANKKITFEAQLLKIVECFPFIKKLIIKFNQIHEQDALSIVNTLKKMKNIEFFHLCPWKNNSRENVNALLLLNDDCGVKKIKINGRLVNNSINNIICHLSKLKNLSELKLTNGSLSLDLSFLNYLEERNPLSLISLKNLVSLDLSHNDLNTCNLGNLKYLLDNHKKLEKLKLINCSLVDTFLNNIEVDDEIEHSLKSLNLSYNDISFIGFRKLYKYKKKNHALIFIDFSFNIYQPQELYEKPFILSNWNKNDHLKYSEKFKNIIFTFFLTLKLATSEKKIKLPKPIYFKIFGELPCFIPLMNLTTNKKRKNYY